jgi:outer membrane protein assembly factor BamB
VGGVPVAAPRVRCGVQRPPLNAAPVVGADGTIFLMSRAHRTERDSFLLALKPTLELKWAASLRGRLSDGCGVTVPTDGTDKNGHCRPGAHAGVDPNTNNLPAGRANDQSSASPIALPDGGVLYGALTTYNGSRGHLLKFDKDGVFQASYDFGWDSTPAVFPHGGTYSIVLKDNHYNDGPFYLTQLDANLQPVWKFLSFETRSCAAVPGGAPVCVDDHPGGFEWCVNSVAVDQDGTTYANSEDGNLYAIDKDGKLRDRIFLDTALGAAYTPISLDDKGRLYPQNNGVLFVVGR